jgi:hypothetical protein
MLCLLMGEIYDYVIEMGLGAIIYIPNFTNLGIENLIGGIHLLTNRHTDSKLIL